MVTSCPPCNNRKGNRLPVEAGLNLLKDPGQPNYLQLAWVVRRVPGAQAKSIRLFFGGAAPDVGSKRRPDEPFDTGP